MGAEAVVSGPSVFADRQHWNWLLYQQPLLLLAAAAVMGVLIDHWVGESLLPAWMMIGLTALVLLVVPRRFYPSRVQGVISPFAIAVLVMATAGINHRWQDRRYESATVSSLIFDRPTPAIVEGSITSTPILRPNPFAMRAHQQGASPWQTSIEMRVDQFRVGKMMQPTGGNLLIRIDGRGDHFEPGDRVRVFGSVRKRQKPTNPGGRDWSTVDRANNIHGQIDVDVLDQIVLIEAQASGSAWHRSIAALAIRGREILLEQLGETSGPLAVALVIGQRDFVSSEMRDDLLITGTAHLLSVSGMHLAIVVTMTAYLTTFLRFPVVARVAFTLAICVFYTALTGGRPPVLRAAVLVSTFMIAIWLRRPSQPINTLAFAALLLVFYNPELVFTVGVQLSFLAVATLLTASGRCTSGRGVSKSVELAIETEDRLNELVDSSRSRTSFYLRSGIKILRSLLWFSLCVTVISAPLVWYQFHVVTLISVITNVLLGPMLFVALGGGILTVMGGLIHPLMAWPAAVMCHAAIVLMHWIIQWAASVPCGHFWLPAPPLFWVVAFYVVLALTLLLSRSQYARNIRFAWIAIWMLVAFTLATRPSPLPKDCVEATFVDVGHGTCVVIRFNDQTWLYDCGRLGNDQGSSRDIDQVLWSMGKCRIDGIVLSHADADHFNSIPGVLRRFAVGQIVTPPGMLEEPESALQPINRAIQRHDVSVAERSLGDMLKMDTLTMTVLHPPAIRIAGSDNANSLVLQLNHAGRSLLLPGDLEPPGTLSLIDHDRPAAGGVLMAPHHGSLAMDSATVLQWARPSETIVSGGRLAERPEVELMLSERGSRVHVTAKVGAIRVRIDHQGEITVATWLESPW